MQTRSETGQAPSSELTLDFFETARAYWQLTRPRIVAMVLFTLAAAALAAPERPAWTALLNAVAGSALLIAGAVALNQWIEHRSDAKMLRTARRPLPSGRLTARQAGWFGSVLSGLGLVYLAATTNVPVVVLGIASWIVYVWMYTPMKMLSAWQTPLGALAGAMPTLMGSAAAGHTWSVTGLTLFGIVYFWQFPHAMAIAWLYRRDFAAADLKVASVVDPSGRTAAVLSLIGAALLLPVSLAPSLTGAIGWGYACVAILTGLPYLIGSVAFFRRTDDPSARWLLWASLVYLPVVCIGLLAAALV
jgi:protoheme IX farnesyltransferase